MADGPSILSAGGPLAVYVTVYCTTPAPSVTVVVDNPAPGVAYTYRLVAQPGTDPVDLAGDIPSSPARPAVWLANLPLGTYTAEVTGSDDSTAVSAPFTVAEPCDDPPLIFFRIRQVPCGPGDETTGISGYLENPQDDEVYTWHVVSENGEMDPVSGPVAPDGTFTLTGLVPGTFSVIFSGDEGSAFESNSFAVYPCPTPTPTPPPPSSGAPSTSPPASTASSSSTPPQPIGSVAGNNTGDTAGLAGTGAGTGLLALLVIGVVALLTGLGVVLSRARTGRRG